MKFKVTTLALLLFAVSATISSGAIRHVAPGGSDVSNDCLSIGSPCASIAHALTEADQGDTILLAKGLYTEGGIDITDSFISIVGPKAGSGYAGRTTFGTGSACFVADEACIVDPGVGYIFSIEADNVTIDGLDLVGDVTATWAAIKIEGGYDRWTIDSNIIELVGDKKPSAASNHSYGVFADANSVSGTATMTGNEITGNLFIELGRKSLSGSNTTAGMAIHLEGISGESAKCNALDKFECGVWIHGNKMEDLAVGQNVDNFVFDVNGKESSTGVNIVQDEENSSPNNGAVVESNEYDDDSVDGDLMDRGVVIGIGDSQVNETNAVMLADVLAYVTNIDRKADIDELALADFFKTLHPSFYGPGSDVYFASQSLAEDNSDDAAAIVHLDNLGGGPPVAFKISVTTGAAVVSYKVSLDSGGNLNLRQGARLLFDGALGDDVVDGVTIIELDGTGGNDLLTVDFNKGNPTPRKDPAGIVFDGKDGFDKIVLRGSEQLTNQTIVMSGPDSGDIMFEPTAGDDALTGFTLGTTTAISFTNLEPIDDLLIVNGAYAVIAPNDTNNEINIIDGPFRFGQTTFQINSGQNATFEEVNFANKKHVNVYGSDNSGTSAGVADDVITVFTTDGEAPSLMLTLSLYGGDDGSDDSDDFFVIRPSKDFTIAVDGGSASASGHDYLFLDCAVTAAACDPSAILFSPYSGLSGDGFKDITSTDIERTADGLASDVVIRKELIGFAADGAHPGDDISYRVTVKNVGFGSLDLTFTPLWVTDVIDHRLSLVEQSVVVESGSVQVAGSNTSMLWLIDDDATFAVGDSISMVYTVIVNTLITTNDIRNYTSILNDDGNVDQFADNGGNTLEHIGRVDLDVLDVFGFPVKAAIQASLFFETKAGPRYMVGLFGGALDPTTGNIGALLCRVPDTNSEVGWDGGLGNLWYSCGEGLPAKDGLFSPLVITDMFQDSAGRIWLTTWGFDGLYFSEDGGQTWTTAAVDLSGGIGGSPDGIPDGFAQIYAITEDILGTLYISANTGDVYRSFDSGVTWQKSKQLPLGSADTAFALEADPTVPGKVYAGTFGDSLYVTNDFAETWQRPDGDGLGNGYIFDIELDPISGNLFVGTARGIYYSSDEGDTWTGLNNAFPFPTNPPEIRAMAFDENGRFFVSTWGQGVWSSDDWQAFSLSFFALKTTNVYDMAVSNGTVYLLAENGITSSYKYTSSTRSTGVDDVDVSEVPGTFALDQNYPNPFNPATSIRFTLLAAQDVNLSVFDILGRRVAVLVNSQLSAGQHEISFQASDLPSGMYLYRLSTPNGSITQKMILLK